MVAAFPSPSAPNARRMAAAAAAVLGTGLLAACASCPPETRVVQERGVRPQLDDALALAQEVLARSEPDYRAGTGLQLVYDQVYAINATNLAWNWEQAWMLCVAYESSASGAWQRRGVTMRVGPDGQPFPVSSVNWRDYSGAAC